MKFSIYLTIIALAFSACTGNGKKGPDVSGIKVNTTIARFDKDYFAIDSGKLNDGLKQLRQQYPWFINDFTAHILGAGVISDSNQVLPIANQRFYSSYYSVYQSVKKDFENLADTEKELNKGFSTLKYYFPAYEVPRFVSYFGPFDAPGAALTENAIAIGLQLYAGKDFPVYTTTQGQEIFPAYISRRFEKPYIASNCIKAVMEDMFPDKSQGLPLVEQMVEKGKYWWLLDQLLPETADSIKTGFTGEQLKWCAGNEGVTWNQMLQNDQLYSMEPGIIQMYIGDAPGTQGFPPAAPGNIGQWIGLRIVQSYISKNPDTTPEQLMKLSARTILDGAKYKPR
ncbi:hypothetical protein ACFSQD_12565 [Flavihumibacter stibioxidans]|uniref:Gliding motility lipoprotein GldB n=1 Tax=Flavihumibacter stibioxidans TaxID=1834163 RepID=A0ABR7MDT5_9BACT|nr:hypothetical protein [Flavihumibacter stibioxidans]MBC6493197.1 hypothetical protein [Flavihumibacter stibioxidans]